jgi:rfaE bifunctional protein kinase chain/domain
MTPNPEAMVSLTDKLRGKKILIVGDVGLDEYVIGSVRRISPEAPVPIVEVSEEDKRLGLASNVAANVASLGGEAFLVGVIGNDKTGEIFSQQLKKNNCSPEYLIVDEDRPTTRKLRVLAGQHHVVRVDFERKKFISEKVSQRLIVRVTELMDKCDGVILEDYAKGVLTAEVIKKIIAVAHKKGKIVTVDPNRTSPVDMYVGADYITPNTDEAIALSELKFDDLRSPSDSLQEVGSSLLQRLGVRSVIVTRGKDGMSAFTKGGPPEGLTFPPLPAPFMMSPAPEIRLSQL